MSVPTFTMPDTDGLVNSLTAQLADVLLREALTCLPKQTLTMTRRAVERHVRRGDIATARSLVTDQVALWCLSSEISRHLHECALCPDLWQHCDVLSSLEGREDVLTARVASMGGI